MMNRLPMMVFVLSLSAGADEKKTIPFDASVETLYQSLKARNISNVKGAVLNLHENFFKLGNYKLVFNSSSIQRSSNKHPRILLFGKDKKLRIGFNHRLGEEKSLELLQWRPSLKKWEMREISFDKTGPKLSEANPGRCLTCHAEPNVQPNFNPIVGSFGLSGDSRPHRDREFFRGVSPKEEIYKKLERPSINVGGLDR